MDITEVRVKLLGGRSDRLRAFCSITVGDEFVVHDLRVIDGRKGLFVAMPSRKLSDNCPRCGGKNHLRAKFCSECGAKLDEDRAATGAEARDKFHVDVAHPINAACRELIQSTVLAAYRDEAARAKEGVAPSSSHEPEEPEELGEGYYEEEVRETEPETALGRVREEPEGYEAQEPDQQDSTPAAPAEEELESEQDEEAGAAEEVQQAEAAEEVQQAEAAEEVQQAEAAEEEEQEQPGESGGFGAGIL